MAARSIWTVTLSRTAKAVVAVGLVLGLFLYLVLLDLGVNAGRIHYGVSVGGFDIGGLTETEAVEELAERGLELREAPVILTYEGFDCRFMPAELGWTPQQAETAELALDVGRADAPFGALADRWRAWFGGVDIDWPDKPRRGAMSELIDECERQAEGLGLELDRFKLRKRIRRAIVTWPRRPFVIPIVEA